jgi:ABC-type multidrug transport system fused ATPase/permease subunit
LLAQQLTPATARQHGDEMDTAITPVRGSALDPSSPHFNSALWIKSFVNLLESDQDAVPSRMTGVAFRHLNVFGHSTRNHFQQTTGNIFLSIFQKLTYRLSSASTRRSQILDDFEGIVDPGEMLLVLGPPGSGCSTFLRALSGRTEGISISKDSYINFRGECFDIKQLYLLN